MIETAKGREALHGQVQQRGAGVSRLGPCSADSGVLPNLATGGKCLSFFCLLRHQAFRQVWIVTPEMFWVPKTGKARVNLLGSFHITHMTKLPRLVPQPHVQWVSLGILYHHPLTVLWVTRCPLPFSDLPEGRPNSLLRCSCGWLRATGHT